MESWSRATAASSSRGNSARRYPVIPAAFRNLRQHHLPPTHDRGHRPAFEGPAVEGGVAGFAAELAGEDGDLVVEVEEAEVGRAADLQGSHRQVEDAGRAGGEELDEAREGEDSGMDEAVEAEAEGGFETQDSEGRGVELDGFFVRMVRRVVARDAVDRAVGETLDEVIAVFLGTERRLHLAAGVEFHPCHFFVG